MLRRFGFGAGFMISGILGGLNPAISTEPLPTREAAVLACPELTESSGLAFSNRDENLIWTHNDSGDRGRVFAFSRGGTWRGTLEFPIADRAVDWEAMETFVDNGTPRMLVGDCGDNANRRKSIQLYLVDEPKIAPRDAKPTGPWTLTASGVDVLVVTYEDGPRDCEAIAVDPQRGKIILVSKSFWPRAGVYELDLPDPGGGRRREATARRVATIPLALISGGTIDPTTGDLWLTSYLNAYRYVAEGRTQSMAVVVSRLPKLVSPPPLKQIEAIAIDSAGDVHVTSEGSPARWGKVKQLVEFRD